MKKRIFLSILVTFLICLLISKTYPAEYIANVATQGSVEFKNSAGSVSVNASVSQTPAQTVQQTQAQTVNTDSSDVTVPDNSASSDVADADNGTSDTDNTGTSSADATTSSKPETTEEIVTKYAQVIKKFKQEKPAYTKKEYQALPEENRQFSNNLVNKLLGFADNYMTKEDSDAATVVREAGYADIINEIPIYGIEDGCLLKDYSAVKNATCTENSDGTYTLSFSLEDEVNPACPIAGSTEPQSNHGAVLMPGNRDEIMVEVEKVEKMTGAKCNNFDMTYRDCTFECVYNPANDQVVSITHHANIDIDADLHFIVDITGTARLTNDMLVYDVKW